MDWDSYIDTCPQAALEFMTVLAEANDETGAVDGGTVYKPEDYEFYVVRNEDRTIDHLAAHRTSLLHWGRVSGSARWRTWKAFPNWGSFVARFPNAPYI